MAALELLRLAGGSLRDALHDRFAVIGKRLPPSAADPPPLARPSARHPHRRVYPLPRPLRRPSTAGW